MFHALCSASFAAVLSAAVFFPLVARAELSGQYLETRTCDVYTGPCFANSEVGLTGQQAILAWSIDKGTHNNVDLTGLKVVMAVQASDTLGFGHALVVHPEPIKSVVLVDERATPEQREALVDLARRRAGKVGGEVVRIEAVPIEMSLNYREMVGRLRAGEEVELVTRKLGVKDCVCTNESVFYPPLTEVDFSMPALMVNGRFTGKGLGTTWSLPKARSAFLATFSQ